MPRQYSILLVAILSILGSQLDAAEPVFTIGKPPLADIAYTPDGRFLATLSDSYLGAEIELLDAESFVSVHRIDSVEGNRHIQFSPDGSQLAIFGDEAGLQLWNVEPPRLWATIPVETVNVAFSPDGRHLAYAVDDTVDLWHLQQRRVVRELTNGVLVTAIAFHPTLPILVGGYQTGPLTFWNVNIGQIQRRLDIGWRSPEKLRFSPDSTFIAILSKNSDVVRLFETATGVLRDVFKHVLDFGFSSDSTYFFLGTTDAMLWRLHLPTGWWDSQSVGDRRTPDGRGIGLVERLTFHPNGAQFASQIDTHRISIWDVKELSHLKTLYGWKQNYTQVAYLPKINRLITGIYTNILHFWDTRTGDLLKTVEFHSRLYQIIPSSEGI